MDKNLDELYMQRAIDLAQLGLSKVSPNPLVGSVLVYQNQVVGQGYHQAYGQAHAEVNAILSVKNPEILSKSTLYVNLEPCSHFGKTPPCANLIIEKKIPKVVIANQDPNPLVAGLGIKRLKENGIEVVEGILEKEGNFLNRRFFTFFKKKRPYIILKWAETCNQYMGKKNESVWISSDLSKTWVHKWRSEEDAFLVGSQTALQDNPRLDVRLWQGRNPVRIVLDRFLKLPKNLQLFDQTQPTICYNTIKSEKLENLHFIKISETHFLEEVLADLFDRKIQSIVVEGGQQTLNLFLEKNLFDEIRLFRSPFTFEEGIKSPVPKGILVDKKQLGKDELFTFFNQIF